jgi:hypothetical protein
LRVRFELEPKRQIIAAASEPFVTSSGGAGGFFLLLPRKLAMRPCRPMLAYAQ